MIPVSRLAHVATVLVGLSLLAAGCADSGSTPTGRPPVEIASSDVLNAKLDELSTTGRSSRLRELTDFSWDTFYAYYEGASAEEVNRAVGETVLQPGTRFYGPGTLGIFTEGGRVVRVLKMRDLAFNNRHVFNAQVIVEAGTTLVDPAPPHQTPAAESP